MSINITDSSTLLALFGMVLLFVGILGGGIEAKEIKIPKVGILVRTVSIILGVAFLLIGIGFRIGVTTAGLPDVTSQQNSPPTTQPTAQSLPSVAPSEVTPTQPMVQQRSSTSEQPTAAAPMPAVQLPIVRISASNVAPPGKDSQGGTITYEPANAIDGHTDTTWRVPGDGKGQFLLLEFAAPVRISQVRLLPGYAKVDPIDGANRFTQNRRIQRVRFEFSDGSSSEAAFADVPELQPAQVGPVVTGFVRIVVLQTTPPGAEDGRDFTAISEIVVMGEAPSP